MLRGTAARGRHSSTLLRRRRRRAPPTPGAPRPAAAAAAAARGGGWRGEANKARPAPAPRPAAGAPTAILPAAPAPRSICMLRAPASAAGCPGRQLRGRRGAARQPGGVRRGGGGGGPGRGEPPSPQPRRHRASTPRGFAPLARRRRKEVKRAEKPSDIRSFRLEAIGTLAIHEGFVFTKKKITLKNSPPPPRRRKDNHSKKESLKAKPVFKK